MDAYQILPITRRARPGASVQDDADPCIKSTISRTAKTKVSICVSVTTNGGAAFRVGIAIAGWAMRESALQVGSYFRCDPPRPGYLAVENPRAFYKNVTVQDSPLDDFRRGILHPPYNTTASVVVNAARTSFGFFAILFSWVSMSYALCGALSVPQRH